MLTRLHTQNALPGRSSVLLRCADNGDVARPARPAKKQVFKLLKRRDVTSDLLEETVHIVWPDNGAWYAATVKQVRLILPFHHLAQPGRSASLCR